MNRGKEYEEFKELTKSRESKEPNEFKGPK